MKTTKCYIRHERWEVFKVWAVSSILALSLMGVSLGVKVTFGDNMNY